MKIGEILPLSMPSGPNNPMGSYALYLGQNYAIHGTNCNFGIGLRVTRGCIRLRPQDIKYLYNLVPIGTRVQFINEPIKITTDSNGIKYLEIHNPLPNSNQTNSKISLKNRVYFILNEIPNVDYTIVNNAIAKCSGIPINITLNLKNKNCNYNNKSYNNNN